MEILEAAYVNEQLYYKVRELKGNSKPIFVTSKVFRELNPLLIVEYYAKNIWFAYILKTFIVSIILSNFVVPPYGLNIAFLHAVIDTISTHHVGLEHTHKVLTIAQIQGAWALFHVVTECA